MTNDDFARWAPLIHHIIRVHFHWAVSPRGSSSFTSPRAICYEDLVSEGSIALLHSWRRYDPERREASFKTYAYRAIVRRMRKFIDSNMSPLSTKNWRDHVRRGTEPSSVARAVATVLFSESADESDIQVPGSAPDTSTDDLDFHTRAITLLKSNLTKREYAILIERARGRTFTQIARKRRMTRETARKIYLELVVKAAALLQDMEG